MKRKWDVKSEPTTLEAREYASKELISFEFAQIEFVMKMCAV